MAWAMPHIQNKGGQVNYYRRAYPVHLRPYLGKTQYRVSLGPPDGPSHGSRLDAARAQYAANIAKAERAHAGKFDELDAPMLAYLGKVFEVEWLQREEKRRLEGSEGWADRVEEGWNWHLDDFQRWYAEGDAVSAEEFWGQSARNLLEQRGLAIDPEGEAFSHLCLTLNEAAVRASTVSLERLSGKPVPTPDAPEPPRQPSREPIAEVPLLATFDSYAAANRISPSVRSEWRNYIQNLATFVGHDDAGRLVRDDVVEWRDHLLITPTRHGKARQPVTVKDKYITALRCTLAWAVEEKRVKENVAADVKVRVPKRTTTRHPDFTMDEAKLILRASLEPPASRLSAPYALARRWIPWLCAYSGARVNELSQLRKEDIRQVEGIWIINITPEAGSVKNRQARQVPIHSHIIEQGFLEAVAAQEDGALFYRPTNRRVTDDPANLKGNRLFKKVGEKLALWVREDVGISDPAIKPNHAWRHLFKTLAIEAGIQERVADAIQGHANTNASRGYGRSTVATKAEALNLFPRFELDLNP